MKPNHQNLIVAIATAIVIALFYIGCNHRTNNNTSVATEDGRKGNSVDTDINEGEREASKTYILNNGDSLHINAMRKEIDFLVNKTGKSFDSLLYKIGENCSVDSVNIRVDVSIDTVHDINKDGFNDLVISIKAFNCPYSEYIHLCYCAVYFGDKFAHYNLHDYYCLGEEDTYGGMYYCSIDYKIDNQGILRFEIIDRVRDPETRGVGSSTILVRYQNGDLYVIGEGSRGSSEIRHYDEGNIIDVEERNSHITRNYLTFKEKDELTGKITELKHAPLKKLSEVFGHKNTDW